MKKGSHRIMGQEELKKRRMKSEREKLLRKAEHKAFKVYSNEAVIPTDKYICVVSFSEYELGEPASNCDLANESYYVEIHDYEEYWEN